MKCHKEFKVSLDCVSAEELCQHLLLNAGYAVDGCLMCSPGAALFSGCLGPTSGFSAS